MIFSSTYWLCLYLLWTNVSLNIWPFLVGFLNLRCVISLHILDKNPLLDIWFANIFFQFCISVFYFVSYFFCNAEASYFNVVSLFFFNFVACALDIIYKKITAKTYVMEVFFISFLLGVLLFQLLYLVFNQF